MIQAEILRGASAYGRGEAWQEGASYPFLLGWYAAQNSAPSRWMLFNDPPAGLPAWQSAGAEAGAALVRVGSDLGRGQS